MTEILSLWVYERLDHRYSFVRGPVRKITDDTSIVPSWSITERCWMVRTDRLGELLAVADLQGCWNVRVRRIEVAP